jgi:hypothetical protein
VHQLSGLSAEVFSAVSAGTEIPAGCEHAVAALVTANILTVDNPPNHRSLLNGTTTAAAPGISRRRLISTGALAAGAATLAATVGIHTFILPTAASAQSPSATLAAPTAVTATPSGSQQITVNWTNVVGATSYKVFYRIHLSPEGTAYTEFVPPSPPITAGPVTVTGLTNTTTYEFYVVAVNATTTSGASTPLANATATAPPVVYAATDGGLSISTDGGDNFTNRTNANSGLGHNLGDRAINNVFGVFVSGSTVYAATDGGLSISTNGGASFTNYRTTDGLGGNSVFGVFASGSTVYAATDGGLSISTNGGATFTNRTTANGLGDDYLLGVFAVESTVGGPATVYAATFDGLSISTDGGTTFTNRTTTQGLGDNLVYGVFASGSTVYAATAGGLSISTNGGASFTNRTAGASPGNGLGDNSVFGLFAVGSTVYAATGGGLSISTDGGTTFTNRTTTQGLGDNGVSGVFATGSTVYAATADGLSISTNGGTSFTNRTTDNGLGNNYLYGVFAAPGAS